MVAIDVVARARDGGDQRIARADPRRVALDQKLDREALDLTRAIGDEQGTARELTNLALTYKYRGDLPTALAMQKDSSSWRLILSR